MLSMENGNYITERMDRIKNIILNVQEQIILLNEHKESAKSQTMKYLIEKTMGISCNILINYVDIFKNIVKYIDSSLKINISINNDLISSINCTVELSKLFVELNKVVKSDNIEDILKACADSCNSSRMNSECFNILSDLYCKAYLDALYLSVLSFSLALNENDYNKHEKLKESILNFAETNLTDLFGPFGLIKDYTESIANIVNATDTYFLMEDFIGNTDENLLKIEKQNDALALVFLNQQLLSKLIAEVTVETEEKLQLLNKQNPEQSEEGSVC